MLSFACSVMWADNQNIIHFRSLKPLSSQQVVTATIANDQSCESREIAGTTDVASREVIVVWTGKLVVFLDPCTLTFRTRMLLMWGTVCAWQGGSPASPVPTFQMPAVPPRRGEDLECLRTLPNIFWRAKLPQLRPSELDKPDRRQRDRTVELTGLVSLNPMFSKININFVIKFYFFLKCQNHYPRGNPEPSPSNLPLPSLAVPLALGSTLAVSPPHAAGHACFCRVAVWVSLGPRIKKPRLWLPGKRLSQAQIKRDLPFGSFIFYSK